MRGVRSGAARGPARAGRRRELRDRQRLSGARRGRPDGRGGRTRPRARPRRRHHTVSDLVEIANSDPRRGSDTRRCSPDQGRRRRDRPAPQAGVRPGRRPPAEAFVKLAATGNMSTGGNSIDRTWEAHEENVEIAEEAARVVGLDVAGIDFLAPDITEPVRETGGAIVEVNAAPGFRCTRTRPRARPSSSPRTSSTCCSPAARPRGSRSSPSPVPTARPRPRG